MWCAPSVEPVLVGTTRSCSSIAVSTILCEDEWWEVMRFRHVNNSSTDSSQSSSDSSIQTSFVGSNGIGSNRGNDICFAFIRQSHISMVSSFSFVGNETFKSRRCLHGRLQKHFICHLWRSKRPQVQFGYWNQRKVENNVESKQGCQSSAKTMASQMNCVACHESRSDKLSQYKHESLVATFAFSPFCP